MMRYFIGIDPGAKGGVALIDENSKIEFLKPFSKEALIVSLPLAMNKINKNESNLSSFIACVEKVGAMPGQGVTSMFNFGKNAGYIEGVLEMAGIPYQLVPPAKWKKEFSLLNKDKKASIEVCKQLFPGVNLLPTERCRKESDGLSDALLLSLYALRKFK